MNAFWKDRPTLITGATGLVGSSVVEVLIESGAEVVCLVRDWVPLSQLSQSNNLRQCKAVHGDIRDQALMERVLGEYEIDTVLVLNEGKIYYFSVGWLTAEDKLRQDFQELLKTVQFL